MMFYPINPLALSFASDVEAQESGCCFGEAHCIPRSLLDATQLAWQLDYNRLVQ